MAYVAPYIDATGMHVPSYTDIRDDLIAKMKQIFGEDIYISEDSQDYQQISIMAKKIHDANSLAMLAYNNRTPITAIGIGLDNTCALVGIVRKPSTYSKVQLTITGTPNTVINNGQASDGTTKWNLPAVVTIPDEGQITVEAVCSIPGKVTAPANSITTIETPIYGWTSVTNNYAASGTNLGTEQESDAELRGRYALATQAPSSTIFEGILAAIEGVTGVDRVKGYENDTDTTSTEGFPPHSISFVVEGGSDEQVATEIYYKKTPGVYTNGTTVVNLATQGGGLAAIRFYRPTEKTIYVKVFLTPLGSYSEAYEDTIKEAIANYINTIQISDPVYRSILMSIAISQMDSVTNPAYAITDIQLSTDGITYSASDISMAFNEVASTSTANITIVTA